MAFLRRTLLFAAVGCSRRLTVLLAVAGTLTGEALCGDEWWKPYSPPCVERENTFEFTEKPAVKNLGNDRYEITFAVKGYCDVTVSIVDPAKELVKGRGTVVRHLASGVLGPNAPPPFQKNSLKQTIYWNGKDDLDRYEKEPEKLIVRVSLGLKPEFDKLLGPTSPKALPGRIWGIAVDAGGVYVFSKGRHRGHIACRKFDHDANYIMTIWTPPANLSEDKLGGMGFVEYEPGKKSLHGPIINWSVWHEGFWMPPTMDGGSGVMQCRPVAADGRIYMLSSGFNSKDSEELRSGLKGPFRHKLYYLKTDGSTESAGIQGKFWCELKSTSSFPHIAVSPDGKTIYAVRLGMRRDEKDQPVPALFAGPATGPGRAKVLVGDLTEPGSSDARLNRPFDVACDAQGRIYVADALNNRVQIFAPDGKFLKSLKVNRPQLVQVHQKTGEIYVSHAASVVGRSVPRITVFGAFPEMSEKRHWDGIVAAVMTLDSWTERPRLWIGDEAWERTELTGYASEFRSTEKGTVRVYEDDGRGLRVISDFEKEARREAGENFSEHWEGGYGEKVICDPVREHVYQLSNEPPDWFFDLPSGRLLGRLPKLKAGAPSDLAFDRRGYMHVHTDYSCTGYRKVVARVDPGRFREGVCAEVPYDYGVEWDKWRGVLLKPATETQAWSWGMGVNMRGYVAAVTDTAYAPKFQDEADRSATLSLAARTEIGVGVGRTFDPYKEFMKRLQELERRGEDLFYIRHRPGIPLYGATIWTWDANGESMTKDGVVIGRRVTGVQIDEDGFVYFTNARRKMKGDKPFLFERGGNYGGGAYEPYNKTPFFGTYMKTRPKGTEVHLRRPAIELPPDQKPARPPDMAHPLEGGFGGYGGPDTWVWIQGAEWLYGGASPIVGEHCDCPQMRASVDWYKRSFVPECYRHSVGVLDSNGNLICHVGQYGNFDSGRGPGSRVPLGGDGVATTRISSVSTTDNYLCMDDWGQRLIVVRLNYYAEEMAPIGAAPGK